jgi:hypothetical protein
MSELITARTPRELERKIADRVRQGWTFVVGSVQAIETREYFAAVERERGDDDKE